MTNVAQTPPAWLDYFLRPVLNECVPNEIAALLEVARSALIYGIFFYPLVTLGSEQCYRILEAGVRLRCDQLAIPTKTVTKSGRERPTRFDENLDALLASGCVLQASREQWDAVRRLRNSASHPSSQMILDPGQAQGQLELTVNFLNDLFK